MEVHDIRGSYLTSDILSTVPLNSVLKLFGLSCISSIGVKLSYSWSLKKVIFLITLLFLLSCVCIYLKIQMTIDPNESFRFKDSVQISYLFDLFHYIVDVFFVYKHGRLCVDYYSSYENIDSVLGTSFYSQINKRMLKICTFLIFLSVTHNLCEYIAWYIVFGWLFPIAYLMQAIYFWLKMLSYLDLISHCIQIEYRLKAIEDVLRNFHCGLENLPGVMIDVICPKYIIRSGVNLKFKKLEFVCNNRYNVVLHLNKCYLLLLEQCYFINIMFGYRIILGNMVSLLNIIIVVNLIIRILLGTLMPDVDVGYFPAISAAVHLFTCTAILFCTVDSCEGTYRQSKRILRMIDLTLVNKKMALEVRESLKKLRDLMVTRPVNFTPVNFFRLEYPTLVSLAAVIITYSLLLLQYVT